MGNILFRITQVIGRYRGKDDLGWVCNMLEWTFNKGLIAVIAFVSLQTRPFGPSITDSYNICTFFCNEGSRVFERYGCDNGSWLGENTPIFIYKLRWRRN